MTDKLEITVDSKWGCWTVTELPRSSRGYTRAQVKCDCGNTNTVRVADLVAGRTKMCKSCAASVSRRGHGAAKKGHVSPEYISYTHMIQRCTNPANKDYKNYGGRGIKVCELWLESYEAFLMCMGEKPDPTYTIERLNGNMDYQPSNCVWASKEVQNRNKRDTVFATIDGVIRNVSEWIEKLGLTSNADAVYKRINRGMDPATALTKPITSRKHNGSQEEDTCKEDDSED